MTTHQIETRNATRTNFFEPVRRAFDVLVSRLYGVDPTLWADPSTLSTESLLDRGYSADERAAHRRAEAEGQRVRADCQEHYSGSVESIRERAIAHAQHLGMTARMHMAAEVTRQTVEPPAFPGC